MDTDVAMEGHSSFVSHNSMDSPLGRHTSKSSSSSSSSLSSSSSSSSSSATFLDTQSSFIFFYSPLSPSLPLFHILSVLFSDLHPSSQCSFFHPLNALFLSSSALHPSVLSVILPLPISLLSARLITLLSSFPFLLLHSFS